MTTTSGRQPTRATDGRDGEDDDEGYTCPRELGAGGVRKTDRDCPLHGECAYGTIGSFER